MEKVRAFHAPYTFFYRTKALPIQLILPDEADALLPVFLDYAITQKEEKRVERTRMLPSDGFVRDEWHSIYTATLPPERLRSGECITYRFVVNGWESEEYCVPLLDEPISFVELDDPTPLAILPLLPQKRIYHGDGASYFRFELAGEGTPSAAVFVRESEDFVSYPAVWREQGYYEAEWPRERVRLALGRVEYYIEAGDGVFSVALGNAERPLTFRAVDNQGPQISAAVPANGEVLDSLDEIRISYFDVSGIDSHASILCVDGINVSEGAIWKKTELLYPFAAPVGAGKHTFELSLRDTLGNRTYYQYEFEISGETVSKKRRRGPLKSAKFMKELVSLVKDVFSPKE